MQEVVSAKVPKELKERARKYGINISGMVRRALEAEVARMEEKDLRKRLDELSVSLSNRLSVKDVVRAVRETRDEL
ncbi:MAG: type II toxin-antitoxin system CcdA family antitoxin [Nitrososphaerota archaeon]|nr:type II toxin-antitoxin system CcdA family antitoxin [Nitrososphaerota archaeon]